MKCACKETEFDLLSATKRKCWRTWSKLNCSFWNAISWDRSLAWTMLYEIFHCGPTRVTARNRSCREVSQSWRNPSRLPSFWPGSPGTTLLSWQRFAHVFSLTALHGSLHSIIIVTWFVSQFSLYFHDVLSKQTSQSEMKNLLAKTSPDYYQKYTQNSLSQRNFLFHFFILVFFYSRIVSFHRKSDALCVCIVLDTNGMGFKGIGYRLPGEEVETLSGLDTYPAIFCYPPVSLTVTSTPFHHIPPYSTIFDHWKLDWKSLYFAQERPTKLWPQVVMTITSDSHRLAQPDIIVAVNENMKVNAFATKNSKPMLNPRKLMKKCRLYSKASSPTKIDQHWSTLVRIGQNWSILVKIDQNWSTLVKIGQNWSELTNIGQNWS